MSARDTIELGVEYYTQQEEQRERERVNDTAGWCFDSLIVKGGGRVVGFPF